MTRWILAFVLFLAATHVAVAAEPQRPKVLAFVAGIERYTDVELDKLMYAADDAREVYKQLGIVADLDPQSKLVVADDDKPNLIFAEQLRAELAKFARRLKNNTNVVVYLGGHGTLSATKELWYLPSDFDPKEQLYYVPFREIMKYFEDHVRAEGLSGVSITFLINVCGAGNAVSGDSNLREQSVRQMRENERIKAAQELYRELRFGEMQVAIIPAAPRDRNTFEDDSLRARLKRL